MKASCFLWRPIRSLVSKSERILQNFQAGFCTFILIFLWNTPLTKTIKEYEYFDYFVNEALFLSEKEEAAISNIIQNIQQEYHSNIDKFSQGIIIISQIETLLNYAERFYHRQFITRKKSGSPNP